MGQEWLQLLPEKSGKAREPFRPSFLLPAIQASGWRYLRGATGAGVLVGGCFPSLWKEAAGLGGETVHHPQACSAAGIPRRNLGLKTRHRLSWHPLAASPYMALYQHEVFTIDLGKVVAVWQEEDETTVTIRTDDQRKIEVAVESPQAGVEFLAKFSNQWEKSAGPLLRHGKYVFLPGAIYSIQAQGEEVYIYFRDHSVSFAEDDAQQAIALLAELSRNWQQAVATWE